jgi:hypothetical protein
MGNRGILTDVYRFVVIAVLVLAPLVALDAVEHNFTLAIAPESEQQLAIAPAEMRNACALHLHFQREQSEQNVGKRISELEVVLVTSDERYFSSADLIPIDDDSGSMRIPLDGAHWGSNGGELGEDATETIQRIYLRVHAPRAAGALHGFVAIETGSVQGTPDFQLQLLYPGLVDRGPWRELQLRLIGDPVGELGELDLVNQGMRKPLFLDQPLQVEDGHWRAAGAAHWVLRLRPDEAPSGTLHWHLGGQAWDSQTLPGLSVVATLPLAAVPDQALPVPLEAPWSGRGFAFSRSGIDMMPNLALGECLTPILSWNEQWGGFRGAQRVSWPQAAACDAAFAAGGSDIELAPQMLLEEHGTFRFGLSPWHATQGGPWKSPRDAWTSDQPWLDLRHHAREVIARARATPGLTRWRLGLQEIATGPAELSRAHGFFSDLVALVAALDGRPLLVLHPQAIDYQFNDSKVLDSGSGSWFSFEDSTEEWAGGPFPITSVVARDQKLASDGGASLQVPLSSPLGRPGEWMGGAFVLTDMNLFNLDQMQFDAISTAPGDIQLYVWVTDEYHRWFQQRLQSMPCDGRWRTMIVDFSDAAAWQSAPGIPWGPQVRRRIRRLGIVGFFHPHAGSALAAAPVMNIDRISRLGWPKVVEPALSFTALTGTSAPIALYEPLQADFAVSLPARNPYDPDSADVVGEAEGPDHTRVVFPAYWSDPMRLDTQDGNEVVLPAGSGGWHWRFTPVIPGDWRYRLHARIKWRDKWKEANSPWTTVQVTTAHADAMPPVRASLRDPQCFETLDGAYFYPLGINLRSPGDSRQDQVLEEVPAHVDDAQHGGGTYSVSADWERLGTRAYERWFPKLRANGINWARVWMCPWWCGVEWTRAWDGYGGLTEFNQAQAARLDRVLDLAHANHIYVQIELMNHGMAGDFADHQWEDSPYNASNGGMCSTSRDFFSDDEAFKATAKRYRYTLARWGWRSYLAAWVLSSEMEFTGAWHAETGGDEDNGRSPSTEKWVSSSLAWFKNNDPFPRPVSIHFSHPWDGSTLWTTQGLGFNNSNAYTGFQDLGRLGGSGGWGSRSGHDLPLALDIYLEQHFPPWRFHRPTIVGEWGGHWSTNETSVLAQEFHSGLWLQAVMPYAGNTGFWWWLWVDKTDKWNEYAQVSRFVAGDDRRGMVWRVNKPAPLSCRVVSIMGMSSANEHRFYAYLTHSDQDASLREVADAGATAIDTGHPDSQWQVERWSCSAGTVEKRFQLTADHAGKLLLPLERIAPDAAFKLSLVAHP